MAPQRFRELTRLFRDCAAEAAAPAPRSRRELVRTYGVGSILAMFVAISGAFGTSHITPNVRYPVVAALTILVIVTDLGIRVVLERWIRFALPPLRAVFPLRAILRTVTFLTCTILVCWGLARLFEGTHGTPPVGSFVAPVLLLAAVVAAVERLSRVVRAPLQTPSRARPGIVDRLPLSLQNAEIAAVEGEDHYVRIHTSQGRHLLHMRFGDALDALKMLEGLQTHRSWWVAKSAVMSVKRGNGRATLKLPNGLEAPVSRRFARRLRDDGWY